MSDEFPWIEQFYNLESEEVKELLPFMHNLMNLMKLLENKPIMIESLMNHNQYDLAQESLDRCDRFLKTVDITKLNLLFLESTLRSTCTSKSKLKEWFPLRDRIYLEMESRGCDMDRRLQGLK